MGNSIKINNQKIDDNDETTNDDDFNSLPKIFKLPIIKFTEESLKEHNKYRKKHNAEPLTLNDSLQNFAQICANSMAKKNEEFHSECKLDGKVIGESLYSNKKFFSGKEFTDNLYKDIKNYNFEKSKCVIKASRFTQLVWKNTKQVGFGLSLNTNTNHFFAVAIYYPPGNKLGNYKENVQNII